MDQINSFPISPSSARSGSISPHSYTGSPVQSPYSSGRMLSSNSTCIYVNDPSDPLSPKLELMELPQEKFRFRYRSEMKGTHGCILGVNSEKDKKKFPTVKLHNFAGQAIVRVSLCNNEDISLVHPHTLEDKSANHVIENILNEHNSYIHVFQGLCIIHDTKKQQMKEDLEKKLKDKYFEKLKWDNQKLEIPPPSLKQKFQKDAQAISQKTDLSSVRLLFEAFEVLEGTDRRRWLCSVASPIINNIKDITKSDLKIIYVSKLTSSCRGEEEVCILVEKVNKKDIKVRFFEYDDDRLIWEDYAKFTDLGVHHQYAIVFRTPPYKDQTIKVDRTVYFQLQRPSDEKLSEEKEFRYLPLERCGKRNHAEVAGIFSSSCGPPPKQAYIAAQDPLEVSQNVQVPEENSNLMYPEWSPNNLNSTGSAGYSCYGQNNAVFVPPLPAEYHGRMPEPVHIHVSGTHHTTYPQAFESQIEMGDSCPDVNELISTLDFSEPLDLLPVGVYTIDATKKNQPNQTTVVKTKGEEEKDERKAGSNEAKKSDNEEEEEDSSDLLTRGTLPDDLCRNIEKLSLSDNSTTPQISNNGKDLAYKVSLKIAKACQMWAASDKVENLLFELRHLLALQTIEGNNAIHTAVIYNQDAPLESMLNIMQKYSDLEPLNAINMQLQTPLILAVNNGVVKMVDGLVRAGADVNIGDGNGDTPCHIAILTDNLQCLAVLIADQHVNLSKCNYQGTSPLHLAVWGNNLKAVKMLCEAGAKVDQGDNTHGRTPLHVAMEKAYVEIAHYLLEHAKASVNTQNYSGDTALHVACALPNAKLCKLLMQYKADPNICNYIAKEADVQDESELSDESNEEIPQKTHYTPYDVAAGNAEIIKILDGQFPQILVNVESQSDNGGRNLLDSGVDLQEYASGSDISQPKNSF